MRSNCDEFKNLIYTIVSYDYDKYPKNQPQLQLFSLEINHKTEKASWAFGFNPAPAVMVSYPNSPLPPVPISPIFYPGFNHLHKNEFDRTAGNYIINYWIKTPQGYNY